MYKVWHPASGLVYGVFRTTAEAQKCYRDNYSTSLAQRPEIVKIW